MKAARCRFEETADVPAAYPASRSYGFFRGWKALLALIVVSTYLLYPSCSSERMRTVFVLHSTLPGYLASSGADVRVEKVRFGNPRHFTTAVLQRVPGRLEWPLRVPSGDPRLEFGVGFIFREGATPGGVVARVTVESEGAEGVLYSGNFWANTENQHLDFHVQQIPLARYAGRPVRIVFESAPSGRGVGDVDIIWGNPTVSASEETTLPNIVLICIDALRTDRVQCYGAETQLTPVLQALADDGVVFSNAVAQAPWTLPSVSSVLTGLYPSLHGAGQRVPLGTDLSREEIERLRREKGFVFTHGNEVYGINLLRSDMLTVPELIGDDYLTHMVNSNAFLSEISNFITRFHSYNDYVYPAYPGYLVTRYASEWADSHRDQLFFLYAHYMEVHEWLTRTREQINADPATDKDLARENYDRMVELDDHYVGMLLERLRELDLYDSSLIIFYSDHGEHLWDGDGNIFGHGNSLSNILLRVPLIVKFPYSEHAGTRIDSYVMLVDLFQTIMAEAGRPAGDRVHSHCRSLRSVVEGGDRLPARDMVSEFTIYRRNLMAVQRGNYRLLYDIANDQTWLVEASTDRRLRRGSSPEVGREAQRLEEVLRSYIEYVELRAQQPQAMELERRLWQRFRDLGYLQ